ncbi:LPS export ABC transporter periplasmic protein LptC [Aquimarina brevivitae]|uniref:LPS export ABC transporter protein LptC n=1 Tax=Aquimarina brevivitae TaxID=323412 RepID=A0A4Q7PHX3_9FLAO|nr:LPS export ABC transporter periplasmic protein LptC [Aquimarina brevivitae]RZS99787.1 LPS export ABC transporter protein LptC [Aquimarina brevivitae]
MNKKPYRIIINFVTALAVTLFFSCHDNKQTTTNPEVFKNTPEGEAFNVNLKYTDSGRLMAVLKSPKILNFNNKSFGYWEFPDGVVLDIIDEEGKVSVIKADFAISYPQTNLIDMRGNVDILTADSTRLKAQQLYWDQEANWIFTDYPYTSILPDGTINEGDGFDANQDFTILNSRINEGVLFIKD